MSDTEREVVKRRFSAMNIDICAKYVQLSEEWFAPSATVSSDDQEAGAPDLETVLRQTIINLATVAHHYELELPDMWTGQHITTHIAGERPKKHRKMKRLLKELRHSLRGIG